MKLKFLLFLLMITNIVSLAQESGHPSIVYDDDNNLSWENFPAISEDGLHYVIIYSEYSCCIDSGSIIQKRSVNDNKMIKEIRISPNETEQSEFTTKKREVVFNQVHKLLGETKYYTLLRGQKYEQIKNESSDEIIIKVDLQNQSYKSKKFDLPKIPVLGYCCTGDFDSRESCYTDQTIENLWVSIKHEVLIIESGVSQLADGCDNGPFYNSVSFFKK